MSDSSSAKVSRGAASVVAAALGGVHGALVAQAVDETSQRLLSKLQRWRLEYVGSVGATRIEERLARGDRPRDDEFFTVPSKLGAAIEAPWGARRSPGFELSEQALLIATNTYEERKLPHLTELWIALMFRGDMTPAYSSYLLREAESLSYRQLCCLQLIGGPPLGEDFMGVPITLGGGSGVGLEVEDLAKRSLIGSNNPDRHGDPMSTVQDVSLLYLKPTVHGRNLCELMDLAALSSADVRQSLEELVADIGAAMPAEPES